jgi:hypothetical protein
MSSANWLTLIASLITLVSVIVSYNLGKQQMKNAYELALKQIKAGGDETSRRLKAEILLTDKQVWIKELRDTVNDLLFFGDPFLDDSSSQLSVQHRVEQITRLAHKLDLLLPISVEHKDLTHQIVTYVILIRDQRGHEVIGKRMACAAEITRLTRLILRDQLASVEANL